MAVSEVEHPYYPRDLNIPNYKPNVTSVAELLGLFFGLVVVVLVCTWLYTKRKSTGVRVKICWFIICGFIHSILEGYFSVFHATLAGESTYLAQMWKEYGQGDSRYLISDSFNVAMETVTAFVDGPLCFLTAAAYMNKTLSPYRYIIQLVVSCFQLYGDTLYLYIEALEGFKHSEMWHPVYFWFYFIFLNAFWIVVPLICIGDAAWNLSTVQAQADGQDNKTRVTNRKKKVF